MPELDLQVLQDEAQKAAMKGAIDAIKSHYTSYDSPFKKQVDEYLQSQRPGFSFEIPDFIAMLNTSLSKEMDALVNTAIAQTYVPLVREVLTRTEPEITFTNFLKEIFNHFHLIESPDDCSLDMSWKDSMFNNGDDQGWYHIELGIRGASYQMTLHSAWNYKQKVKESDKRYQFLSLPSGFVPEKARDKIIVRIAEGEVELPYTRDILVDPVMRSVSRLMLCETKIILDTTEITDDMFPEKCRCH